MQTRERTAVGLQARYSLFLFLSHFLGATSLSSVAQSTLFTHNRLGNLLTSTQAVVAVPVINVQPVNQLVADDGKVYFTALASGAGALSHQWLSNGVAIPGATGEVLALPGTTSSRNLLNNGEFETPLITSGTYLTYAAGQSFGGWVVESGTVALANSLWQAVDGLQSLNLAGASPGAIYQTIPTVPGQDYYLRFYLGGNTADGPTVKASEVWWNDHILDAPTLSTTGPSTTGMAWTNLEYRVTATSNVTRLRFVGLTTGLFGRLVGPVIDAVSLYPVPPPSPAFSVIVSNAYGSVTSSVARVEVDLDRNGLPDLWEHSFFGRFGQSASADFDGDGVSNQEEFLEGTNPTDAGSFHPRLTVTASGNGSISISPTKPSYSPNEIVHLTARPNSGSWFNGWGGDHSGVLVEANIVMDRTKSIQGIFGLQPLTNGVGVVQTLAPSQTHTFAFNAQAGDGFVIEMAELSQGSPDFNPQLKLYDPSGALIGAHSAVTGALLSGRATNSGVFTVVAASQPETGSGSYRLTLAQALEPFTVPAGDEGGQLINGSAVHGTIPVGDLDMWRFHAEPGDHLFLRIGATVQSNASFYPRLFVFDSQGVLLAQNQLFQNFNEEYVETTARFSGMFTVVVNSHHYEGSGAYRIELARFPIAPTETLGNQGGQLLSGGRYDGTNEIAGQDIWTFEAKAGDNIVLRCPKTSGTFFYKPWVRLFGPDGAMVATDNDAYEAFMFYQPTNSGRFAVLVESYFLENTGTYQIGFARVPGPFVVPPEDEGGGLLPGQWVTGTTPMGDLDLWTFTAFAGHPFDITLQSLGGSPFYLPRLLLFGSGGELLGTTNTAGLATLSFQPTNSGVYTALVDSNYRGHSGNYRLFGNGFSRGLKLSAQALSATNRVISGDGGLSNLSFVVLSATNLSETTSWTPMMTNRFDASGAFSLTNVFDPVKARLFLRLWVP